MQLLKSNCKFQRRKTALNFADAERQTAHTGHFFVVRIYPKKVKLQDLKTGVMALATREARLAKMLSKEQELALKKKEKPIPFPTEIGKWHDLLITFESDKLSVMIDGQPAGSFSSEGIAHLTKRMHATTSHTAQRCCG